MKKTMLSLAVIFVFYFNSLLFPAATGNPVGKVYQKNPVSKEVVVAIPKAAEQYQMGDKLSIMVGNEEVVLSVTFPMMTLVKTKIVSKNAGLFDKITAGMPVYKYGKAEKIVTKYYTDWDRVYFDTEHKVRFINEVAEDALIGINYYFKVEYDSKGLIIKSTEYKNQQRTVVDHYRDDMIIKKEWYQPGGDKLERLYVYDYYDSGYLRYKGEYDYINNVKRITKFTEGGTIENQAQTTLDDTTSEADRIEVRQKAMERSRFNNE